MSNDDDDDKPLGPETIERIKQRSIKGIGYGSPPEHSRFCRGQSGNPNGWPRGSPADIPFSDQPIQSAKRGAPAPVLIPHPDDILIEDDVRFLGPVTEED